MVIMVIIKVTVGVSLLTKAMDTMPATVLNLTVVLKQLVELDIRLLNLRLPRLMPMTTMHGPSRHMDLTSTPGGASLMTQLRPGLMTMSTTHVRLLLMTTSGPRIATFTQPANLAITARLLLLTKPLTVLLTSRRPPSRATKELGMADIKTLMPMAAIRTSMRRYLTMTPAPKHTRLSLMMRGTTKMTTNGAHRHGAQTKISTVLPLMDKRLPKTQLLVALATQMAPTT